MIINRKVSKRLDIFFNVDFKFLWVIYFVIGRYLMYFIYVLILEKNEVNM